MKTTRTIGSSRWVRSVVAACAVTLILAAATADDATELQFAPFSQGGWGFHVGGEYPGAAGRVEAVEDEKGRQILQLHYEFSAGGVYVGGGGPVPKTGRIAALLLNVNAPQRTNIMVRFFDKTGQVFQKAMWTETGGWQPIRFDIDGSWETVFGGAGSKKVHWPIQAVMLSVRKNVVEQGVIEFADLRVISIPPTPEQMRVERRQGAFTGQLSAWRHAWLDYLQSAAGVEQVLDRSILLASYGQLSNPAMQPKLNRQLEHLWQQMRDVERQWDEANLAVGRAENDAQLDEAIEQAERTEAALAMTGRAAGALLAEAGEVLGGKWLALERPQARQWVAARDSPAQFAGQWHHIVSHVPQTYIEDHVLRPREFANVMVESLDPKLKRDGTLDESSIDYIEKYISTAAEHGFAVVPNIHNIGFVAARGPQLPQWFVDEHGEENAVIRTEPEHGLRTPNYWYPPSVDVIVEAVGRCAAHFEGDRRVLAFEYENEAMMYRFHEVYTNRWVRQSFTAWLTKRYGGVNELNATWGTNYTAIDEADPPPHFKVIAYDEPPTQMARAFDFRLFLRASYADYFRRAVKAFHHNNQTHPIMPQFMSYFNFHQDNMMDTYLDSSVGWDVIVNHEGGGRLSYFHGHWGFGEMNYLASHGQLLGKPTVADEFIWNMPEADSDNAQSLYGRALDVHERRRAGRRNIWEALAWGKTGVVLFSLHPSSGWGNHMIGGGDPPRLSAMAGSALAMRATAEKVRQVTAGTRVMFAPVALLETLDATYMSRPAEVPLHEARALNYFAAMRHLPLFYLPERALAAEQASLDEFKVIIAPYCYLLSRPLAADLERWVRKGGYLIASGPIDLSDGHGRRDGALANVMTFNTQLSPPGSNEAPATINLEGNSRIDMKPWRNVLWHHDGSPLPDGTEALLRLTDGRAVITETRCGRGWIVQSLFPLGMISTALGGAEKHFKQGHPESQVEIAEPDQRFQSLLWQILTRRGDLRPVRSDTQMVTLLRHQSSDEREYLFVINMDPTQSTEINMDIPAIFSQVSDMMLNDLPVPVRRDAGATRISMRVAAGDGTLLKLMR